MVVVVTQFLPKIKFDQKSKLETAIFGQHFNLSKKIGIWVKNLKFGQNWTKLENQYFD